MPDTTESRGGIVYSSRVECVEHLVEFYSGQFARQYLASMPPREKPTT